MQIYEFNKEYLEILHDNDQKFSIAAEKFIEDQGILIPWTWE